ncbi:hypothetical protein ACX93W_14830 [Paenibacillus sp. CAU 1782]
MQAGSVNKNYMANGEAMLGRRTEGYSSAVRWFKEPGVFNGKLEVEASKDEKGILAGPCDGKLIVTGDKALLIIKGEGEFTLQNIEVDGDLVIHLPAGGVTLLDSVKVAGTTLVIAGDPMAAVEAEKPQPIHQSSLSFRSSAEHGEEIILLQSQLLNVHLEGSASVAEVAVHLSGPLSLSGVFRNVLISPTAGRLRLKLEQGAFIGGALKLMASEVQLDAQQGSIFDLWNDPHHPLCEEAAVLAEQASAKLADINESADIEGMERALAGAGILANEKEMEMLLDQLQLDSYSSLSEVVDNLELLRTLEQRTIGSLSIL